MTREIRRREASAPTPLYDSTTHDLHIPSASPLLKYTPAVGPDAQPDSWFQRDDTTMAWYNVVDTAAGDSHAGAWFELGDIASARGYAVYFDLPQRRDERKEHWVVMAQANSAGPIELASGQFVPVGASSDKKLQALIVQASCTSSSKQSCGTSDDPFVLRGVEARLGSDDLRSAFLDDASPLISYQGYTSAAADSAAVPEEVLVASALETLSWTSTGGAQAVIHFHGTALSIIGSIGQQSGDYQITVSTSSQPDVIRRASSSRPLNSAQQILAFVDGMDDCDHVLTIENLQDGCDLVLDGFWAYGMNSPSFSSGPGDPTPPATSTQSATYRSVATTTTLPPVPPANDGQAEIPIGTSGPNVGTIVGIIFGVLGGLTLLGGIYMYLRPKKQDETKPRDKHNDANDLNHQENQFVSVNMAPESGADVQKYFYPGATATGSGGMPKSPF